AFTPALRSASDRNTEHFWETSPSLPAPHGVMSLRCPNPSRKADTQRFFVFAEVREITRATQGFGHDDCFPDHLGPRSVFAGGFGRRVQAPRALDRRPVVACRRPSTNAIPARTSGSKCAPSSRRHRACAMSRSLKAIKGPFAREPAPFVTR